METLPTFEYLTDHPLVGKSFSPVLHPSDTYTCTHVVELHNGTILLVDTDTVIAQFYTTEVVML